MPIHPPMGCYPLIQKTSFILVWQYIASGVLGSAAFEGRIATALLGVLIHFIISFVIAVVFILSADRIPLLRRYAIVGSLLYGFGVFIVMNMMHAFRPLGTDETRHILA